MSEMDTKLELERALTNLPVLKRQLGAVSPMRTRLSTMEIGLRCYRIRRRFDASLQAPLCGAP